MGGLLHHDFVNRGKGVYEEERERLRLPALVESGRSVAPPLLLYPPLLVQRSRHLQKRAEGLDVIAGPCCCRCCRCRHAGRSRVEYRGAGIAWHKLSRDFFITCVG